MNTSQISGATLLALVAIGLGVLNYAKPTRPLWWDAVGAVVLAPTWSYVLLVYQGTPITGQVLAGIAITSAFTVASVLGISYTGKRAGEQVAIRGMVEK